MRDLYYYHELEDQYEDMLNACYETVSICGYEYDQGHALRNLDPVAFRRGVSDWVVEEFEEVSARDCTDEEKEHYILSDNQTVYLRGE